MLKNMLTLDDERKKVGTENCYSAKHVSYAIAVMLVTSVIQIMGSGTSSR